MYGWSWSDAPGIRQSIALSMMAGAVPLVIYTLILRKTIEGGQHDAAELNNGHAPSRSDERSEIGPIDSQFR
jgi:hypothetical protein